MDDPATILTVLSMAAYCAVVVMLWRFAIQPSVGARVRAVLRLLAGVLLFALVLLWTAE